MDGFNEKYANSLRKGCSTLDLNRKITAKVEFYSNHYLPVCRAGKTNERNKTKLTVNWGQ